VRITNHLGRQYTAIAHYSGLILLIGGVLMLCPLVALAGRPQESRHIMGLVAPAVLLLAGGGLLWFFFQRDETVDLPIQNAGVAVLLSWITVCLFSAWPFVAIERMSLTHAIFESVSGWTTTGLSVLDVTQSTRIVLLWRSLMQLAGGAGLAIIMLAAIVGPIGPALAIAEGRTDQLVPHVRKSGKLVLMLYAGYVVLGVPAYRLAGMDLFDAVNHTFTAISTGGFSTHAQSIGYWDSLAVEAVSIPLMLLGSLNFLTAYLLLRGRFRAVVRNGEVRLASLLLAVGVGWLLLLVCAGLYPTLSKSLRVSVFETVTALTTTGFSTVDYHTWNSAGWLLQIILMLIGGGACSTAGGIKQHRVYLLAKSVIWDVTRSFRPRTAVVENSIWQGQHRQFVADGHIRKAGTFLFLYLSTYLVGAAVLAANGYGVKESLFEFASTLGTVGLSVGVTGPDTPSTVLWTQIAGMFLGRLEFFVVIVSLGKIGRDMSMLARATVMAT